MTDRPHLGDQCACDRSDLCPVVRPHYDVLLQLVNLLHLEQEAVAAHELSLPVGKRDLPIQTLMRVMLEPAAMQAMEELAEMAAMQRMGAVLEMEGLVQILLQHVANCAGDSTSSLPSIAPIRCIAAISSVTVTSPHCLLHCHVMVAAETARRQRKAAMLAMEKLLVMEGLVQIPPQHAAVLEIPPLPFPAVSPSVALPLSLPSLPPPPIACIAATWWWRQRRWDSN